MNQYLKGNYQLNVVIDDTTAAAEIGATAEFERKALSRLGGSICFVSKKAFVWNGPEKNGPEKKGAAG
jgi:hypothetical protein